MRSRQVDSVAMQRALQRVFVPRSIRDRIVVTAKRLLVPGETKARRAALQDLEHPFPHLAAELESKGALLFGPKEIEGASDAARSLAAFCEQLKAQGHFMKPENQRKGSFLVTLARDSELLALPAVRRLALGVQVSNLVAHYFGELPVLSAASLWWSPPNETLLESQLYHYDGEDRRQLKMFLNVADVTDECGPFTFLDAETSAQIPETHRHSARIADETVDRLAKRPTQLIGSAGSVAFVDTSRCLHFGSRGNSADRLVLMVQFTRFLAPKARLFDLKPNLLDPSEIAGLTPVERRLLAMPA